MKILAERRMFSKSIIDTDAFLSMPLSTQALYFHLCMRADDDGFVASPRKIQRMISCSEDDLKLLIAKRYILVFDSGVIVIKHWKIHNYIRNDRYKATLYTEEKNSIVQKADGIYTDHEIPVINSDLVLGIPSDNQMDTQVRLGKVSIGKDSIDNIPQDKPAKSTRHKYGEFKNVLLTDEQLEKLKIEYTDWEERIEKLSNGIELKGYKYKNHYLAIRKWAEKDKPTKEVTPKYGQLGNFV